MRRANETPEAVKALRKRVALLKGPRRLRKVEHQQDVRPRDDLSIGERSLAAALKAGARWEPAFH